MYKVVFISFLIILVSTLLPLRVQADAPECYTVQSGDTLWRISLQWNVSWVWVAQYNQLSNPHLIFPGQVVCWQPRNIVTFALEQVGKPYVWAGIGPNNYDCSGLISAAYQQQGRYIPHYAHSQYLLAISVIEPQRGDLAFFGYNRFVYHVGIMLDSETMIDASYRKGRVVIESIYVRDDFMSFGRIE